MSASTSLAGAASARRSRAISSAGQRVARPDPGRLGVGVDRVVGAAQALLVQARDLQPEREAPGLLGLRGDELDQRLARLVEAPGLAR